MSFLFWRNSLIFILKDQLHFVLEEQSHFSGFIRPKNKRLILQNLNEIDPGDPPIARLWWTTLYMLPSYSNGLIFCGAPLSPW